MTRDNNYSFLYEGYYWRMFNYIPHEPLNENPPSLSKVYEAGKAYGKFEHMLSDLPGKPLNETIPRFHDMDFRHHNFLDALKNGNPERIKIASAEIDAASDGLAKTETLQKLIREKVLPQRIIHHDAKMSNILFNKEGRAISVIDLDTVMMGIIHSDFGDSMRTFANTADEDEKDTSLIKFNLPAFKSYTKGYMEAVSSFISKLEVETLYLAPYFITCQQAVRFLTDYLLNDIYYHISYPDHNLVRTRAQLTLMARMWEAHPVMEKIINQNT
jgi:Ser/Thr protein kinase RdoA (MazF antagonist)